ncbi:MAG: hypothetical protein BAJATHORv1_30145 [Candidatus Thorarchaeota archaeon]|nr:MAG: hypothetical protein BAJATHORv1_30145 [Candidatus Thorarchaeota archaeon]
MSYLTWREYVRSGPVCLGALLVIAGAVVALLPTIDAAYDFVPGMTTVIGAVIAVVGLVLILIGFFFTSKKRDSVLRPVDTKEDDTPPAPPPPD